MALFDTNFKLGSLFSSLGSIYQMSRGIGMQEDAARVAGQGFRQDAVNAGQVAEYNIALDQREFTRQLDAFSRQIAATASTQVSQASVSGIDIGSQSTLSVINQGLDQAIRATIDARNDVKITADQRRFQAQQQQVALENRARLAEFQGEVAAYQSRQRLGRFIPSLANQIGSLF